MRDRSDNTSQHREADALARLLRAADPAAGSDGLEGVERARMREAVVAAAAHRAAEETAGAWPEAWWQPALAGATVLVLALALGYWTLLGGGERHDAATPGPAIEIPEAAGRASQADAATSPDPRTTGGDPRGAEAIPSLPAPAASEVSSTTIAALPSPGSGAPSTVTDTAALSVPSGDPVAVEPAADRQPRTLYFTAPRGTQIIWTLDPEYESPIAGQTARQ